MFQRLKERGRNSPLAEPRVTFAAFGKHPGWDDHMPDIGVVTERLAALKQCLYVTGIGGQIDSGAWERLEPEKRLEGFDHTFLWTSQGEAVLGQLWSSTDRKGRSKYPMAACVHGELVPLGVLLDKPRQVLDQVRDGCKATTSANHVVLEARAAQDQLTTWLSGLARLRAHGELPPDSRRRFLEHPALQPDSLGLLRVLHELDNATGRSHPGALESKAMAALHPYHIRVPLCAGSPDEALRLWTAFLRTAVPELVPLLLIVRHRTDWLDVILGAPGGDDLFCLQASLKALPTATVIPYDIAPELKHRLQQLKAAFLQGETGRITESAPRATTVLDPASADSQRSAPADSARPRRLVLAIGAVLVLVCLALGFWLQPKLAPNLFGKRDRNPGAPRTEEKLVVRPNEARPANQENPEEPQNVEPNDLLKRVEEERRAYDVSMREARSAFDRHDFTGAIAQAEIALSARPGDSGATTLKAEAEAEQTFQTALNAAQAAFDRGDYAEAISRAEAAAAIKNNDATAAKLKEAAVRQLAEVTAAAEQEAKYHAAIQAAREALDQQNYPEVIAQADIALALRSQDPEGAKLKLEGQRELAYRSATEAFALGDYPRAFDLCQPHSGAERFDRLIRQIGQEQDQMKMLRKALSDGSYPLILETSLPAKAPFENLKSEAADENRALQQARDQLSAGDYRFLDLLERQSYKSKTPFRVLLEAGHREREALMALHTSQRANQRETVRESLAKLPSDVRGKKPFVEVEQWAAERTPAEAQNSPPVSAPGTPANWENVLRALEVRFGLRAEDANVLDRDGKPVKRETNLTKAKRAEAVARVRHLKEYRGEGWQTEERKARLQTLDEAIRAWRD